MLVSANVHYASQISAVRAVVPNKSNNEIVLVLQHFENCVDKAVQAFLEGMRIPNLWKLLWCCVTGYFCKSEFVIWYLMELTSLTPQVELCLHTQVVGMNFTVILCL